MIMIVDINYNRQNILLQTQSHHLILSRTNSMILKVGCPAPDRGLLFELANQKPKVIFSRDCKTSLDCFCTNLGNLVPSAIVKTISREPDPDTTIED